MLDGGFITKKLLRKLGRFPTEVDVQTVCTRIIQSPHLSGALLMRIFFYDAPPLQKVVINPLDGSRFDLGASRRAREATALHEALELLPDFAVRRGKLLFHGWKLGDRATKNLQAKPRPPVSRDFCPDIKQKGVDLRIGLDIAWISLKRLVDILVVVAGDADLVPAFKLARKEGVRVYLDHLGHPVCRDLKVHVDRIL